MTNKSESIIKNWENEQAKKVNTRIVLNRIKTPDGTILTSRHVHDYVTYTDKNGLEYMVDGGLDYLRRNMHNVHPFEELSVTTEAPFEIVRESFEWGTYGKNGDQPLTWIPLSTMTEEHLNAIIDKRMSVQWVRDLMNQELQYRKQNSIIVKDEQ